MAASAPAYVLHRGVGTLSRCTGCATLIAFADHPVTGMEAFERDPAGLWVLRNGAALLLGGGVQLERDHTGAPETRYRLHSHAGVAE